MSSPQQTIVWDRFIRFFHWSLVICFIASYITSQSGMQYTHSYLGYYVSFIILARIVWGFVGSRYARFNSFFYTPLQAVDYLKQEFRGNATHYTGHNPAGSIMVYAILVVMLGVITTGLITLATIEFEGPFVKLLIDISDETAYFFQDIHAWLINLMWLMIILHIMGVVSSSIRTKENLVRPMITGRKTVYKTTEV